MTPQETPSNPSVRQSQYLGGIRTELSEWKDDLTKLWSMISYFTKEVTSKKIYVITAANGSAILEQRVTMSTRKSSIYLKEMQDKWQARNVHLECKRIT